MGLSFSHITLFSAQHKSGLFMKSIAASAVIIV